MTNRGKYLLVADRVKWVDYWMGPVQPFSPTLSELKKWDTVVLAPETTDSVAACQHVIDWKKQGLLPGTRLILGTYKGRHLCTPSNAKCVSAWVVHCNTEKQVLPGNLWFLPLALSGGSPGTLGDYAFMGGRSMREPAPSVEALNILKLPGLLVGDVVKPKRSYSSIRSVPRRVPQAEYLEHMRNSRVVLLPLKNTPVSHGHCDAVRAILCGKPLLVTRGCSCDDYVQHGKTGWLVEDNRVESWVEALGAVWDRAGEMGDAALDRAHLYSPQVYAESLWSLVRAVE